MGPFWLLGTLAAVMIAVAGLSAARLAAASVPAVVVAPAVASIASVAPAAVAVALPRPGARGVNGTSTPADSGQYAIDRPRRRGRPRRRVAGTDIDIAHLLMAIAMAGMLVAGLRTLPDGVWAAVLGGLMVWFIGRVLREARGHGLAALAGGHHTPHLVHSSAMLYMFLAAGTTVAGTSAAGATAAGATVAGTLAAGSAAVGGGPQIAGMAAASGAGLRFPTLALALALALAGYAVRDLDRLTGSAAVRRGWIAPRVATGCRIAMGIVMAYMLIIMI